jgi:hypothetical protein
MPGRWNLGQAKTGCTAGPTGTVDLGGKTLALTLTAVQPGLRVNLRVAGKSYCTDLGSQQVASLPVSGFRDQCWLGAGAPVITPSDAARRHRDRARRPDKRNRRRPVRLLSSDPLDPVIGAGATTSQALSG